MKIHMSTNCVVSTLTYMHEPSCQSKKQMVVIWNWRSGELAHGSLVLIYKGSRSTPLQFIFIQTCIPKLPCETHLRMHPFNIISSHFAGNF